MKKYQLAIKWIETHRPEPVTRIVFTGLVKFYDNGKPGWIFRKLESLEQSECYDLCSKLFDLMKYIGIEKEYINWKNQNK